jgi:DNA polymerase elongation subunit (family B)
MELVKIGSRPARILDFDIENRPLSYLGSDFTTADITAIAAGWSDEDEVKVWALGEVSQKKMLTEFVKLYNQADIVTGHFIRDHDLPHINASLMELGLDSLSEKLTSCTKRDLIKRKGISASQESLGAMVGLDAPKVHMSQVDWREANRLTKVGIAKTKERVSGDIVQHKQLREALVARNWLRPPKMWKP